MKQSLHEMSVVQLLGFVWFRVCLADVAVWVVCDAAVCAVCGLGAYEFWWLKYLLFWCSVSSSALHVNPQVVFDILVVGLQCIACSWL